MEQLQATINTQNVPIVVASAVQEYLAQGYTVIPGVFTKHQLNLAWREWNYHTTSRGIDLDDSTTWHSIKEQHDWKQGWAKWMFTTGIQVLANTHPMIYTFVAKVTTKFELYTNWYKAKIHLPNTGGAFMHNDLNWFKFYDLVQQNTDVQAINIPQIVVFLTDTVADQAEFFLIPSMYDRNVWFPIVESLYSKNAGSYETVSAMDITQLCPGILKQRISVNTKAGDMLFFNSLVTHRPSNNLSSMPQLCCYPNLAPVNDLANPREEVLDTWLNGTHPKRYGHFFTGNYYKRNVIHARSARRHYSYPLGPISRAIVGGIPWTHTDVV